MALPTSGPLSLLDIAATFGGSEPVSLSQYYAGGLPGANADAGTQAGLGAPLSTTGAGLPNSGSVISSIIGQPLNVMNPYLTINYIIYTGVLQ